MHHEHEHDHECDCCEHEVEILTLSLDDGTELYNIPGNVPNSVNMPNYCYFKERCAKCTAKCSGDYPGMIQVSPTHYVACHLYSEEDSQNG